MKKTTIAFFIGAFVATFWTNPTFADEARCDELGATCICSEPFDVATVDGGSPFPATGTPGAGFNFDADPIVGKSCSNGLGGAWTGRFDSISAAGQALPTGNTLTRVLKHEQVGTANTTGWTGQLTLPAINEGQNATICTRTYQRWDPTANAPDGGINPNAQYKVQTIGGQSNGGTIATFQISVTAGGGYSTRADSSFWDCPASSDNFQSIAECKNNWCRFETCLDFSAAGALTPRYRLTELEPSANAGRQTTVVKATCNTTAATFEMGVSGQNSNNTPGFFSQYIPTTDPIRYASHAMLAITPTMDSNFWIGEADEVEGGGAPPVDPTPPLLKGVILD